MRLQLRGSKVSVEQQQANDRHQPWVVAAVLGVLAVYAYLFTPLASYLHIPSPAEFLGPLTRLLYFEQGGNLQCRLRVFGSSSFDGGAALLLMLAVLGAAFLCAYYAPLPYKRASTACLFVLAFLALYGPYATALLLAGHMAVYLSFHGSSRDSGWVSAVFGACLAFALFPDSPNYSSLAPLAAVGLAGASFAAYRFAIVPLLRVAPIALVSQTVIIQTPLLLGIGGAVYEGMHGDGWKIPMGLLFVFWQWERLMVYHADFKAGDVPEGLPFLDYLSVFMTPGILANWQSAPYVGQAYTYLSSRFLCEDKNKIALSGLRLWGIALLYIVFGERLLQSVAPFMHDLFGVTVYTSTTKLVQQYVAGTRITTATVLLSTFLDQTRIFIVFGALTHFRTGAWRVLGHDVDPQYNKPWMATNLVTFWSRFAFHYREFLVRTFYYPVFFRVFKKNLYLRVFAATLISTSIGNHIWGHIPDRVYSKGITWDNLVMMLRAWPYYVLLGTGISLTQLYLMRKGRTRRAWTRDWRFGLDILASYCTLQYFCIIHIFARPQPDSTLADLVRLFLIGFGIRL